MIQSSVGATYGHKVKNQGNIGLQAWHCAKQFGLNINYPVNNGTNSDVLSDAFIDSVLEKINEELKILDNKK
ncbi:hypothetical protein [Borreliella valaisiana]|uniref:hypothetical protein n=1 Tax=Borreliella valaisiana TaxID=62088 RepID=UPI002ED4FC7F|nr:hypothetical protein KJD09_04365 [Borreliella valaisiana]